jgi:dTDP-4-dehydrorhamnose reductase
MKIIILGAAGQVGRELTRSLAGQLPANNVPADTVLGGKGTVLALDRQGCDLGVPGAAAAVIDRERPAVVVNAAAYTAVDKAESDAASAHRINAVAVAEIAAAVRRLDGLLVHYSTDYVFDGTKTGPYREHDTPAPLGVYGATKLAGEEAVAASGCRNVVFRTSWVHARQGANFIRTILRLAGERDALRVVADQVGAPTGAALIATVTAVAIGRWAREPSPPGLLHLAPSGETTWCDYARFVIGEARAAGARLRIGPEAVVPITTAEYPTPARRPANSRLDTGRLTSLLDLSLPSWEVDVRDTVAAVVAETGPAGR